MTDITSGGFRGGVRGVRPPPPPPPPTPPPKIRKAYVMQR